MSDQPDNGPKTDPLAALIALAAKPGWKSTEWWYSLFISLCGLLAFFGVPDRALRAVALGVVGAVAAAYVISRGIAKGGPSAPAAPSLPAVTAATVTAVTEAAPAQPTVTLGPGAPDPSAASPTLPLRPVPPRDTGTK